MRKNIQKVIVTIIIIISIVWLVLGVFYVTPGTTKMECLVPKQEVQPTIVSYEAIKPTLYKENDSYIVMYKFSEFGEIHASTSSDGVNWSKFTEYNGTVSYIPTEKICEIQLLNGTYIRARVILGLDGDVFTSRGIFIETSIDGDNWSIPIQIMQPNKDHRAYRYPSLIEINHSRYMLAYECRGDYGHSRIEVILFNDTILTECYTKTIVIDYIIPGAPFPGALICMGIISPIIVLILSLWIWYVIKKKTGKGGKI